MTDFRLPMIMCCYELALLVTGLKAVARARGSHCLTRKPFFSFLTNFLQPLTLVVTIGEPNVIPSIKDLGLTYELVLRYPFFGQRLPSVSQEWSLVTG